MKFAWNGKNRTWLGVFAIFFILLPGCDDAPMRPGEGFYSYRGYRDWWRIPLIFPYQIKIIDSFDRGSLEKYDPNSLISNARCDMLADDIIQVGFCNEFTVFNRKKRQICYGILLHTSGEIRFFSSLAELTEFAKQKVPRTSFPPMMNLENFYDLRWKNVDAIQKRDPQKLYYPESDSAPKSSGEGFYTYHGFRDWWRIPLRFPYQIKITDSFAYGGKIEKYDRRTLIVSPQIDILVEGITKIGYESIFAVFQRKAKEDPYGILIYASGETLFFQTEEKLADFIRRNYPGIPFPEMLNLEEFYKLMWQAIDKIRETDPQKLSY